MAASRQRGVKADGTKGQVGLENAAKQWPTPKALTGGANSQRDSRGAGGADLQEAVNWPTPTSRDYKDGSAQSCQNVEVNGLLGRAVHGTGQTSLPDPESNSTNGNRRASLKLSADWVEALHGRASNVDRLRLLGNGVYPATAARAFVTLYRKLMR
jgi:hypothetical protein